MTRRSLLYCLSLAAFGITDAVISTSAALANPQVAPPTAPELSMEAELLQRINKEREKCNAPALVLCDKLSQAARVHTHYMASVGNLCHDDGQGHFARDRVKDAGYGQFIMLGENLAMNGGYKDPAEQAVLGWMKSSNHRLNVIEPQYTQTGVAAVEKDGSVYFTQIFALPAPSPV